MQKKIEKPWGFEDILYEDSRMTVKRIVVRRGHATSLQYHPDKEEMMFFVNDGGKLVYKLLPRNEVHRIDARNSLADIEVIEVSTGDQSSIVRLEDLYGRK